MIKKINFILPVLIFTAVFGWYYRTDDNPIDIQEIREKHSEFLRKNRPEKADKLSRLQRIQKGVPPNQYYELMEYLTMNPQLGVPEPHKVRKLHQELMRKKKNKNLSKAPGDSRDRWNSRGPNNVGGRTRVVLFDPNDPDRNRVFAGAISGGLWVNDDITQEFSPWEQVSSLPGNLNISCITVDPRDANIWYAGTGEQYTGGDVVGTGVYKTTDGGSTWEKVLDVEQFSRTVPTEDILAVGGLYYINDIQAWDNGNSTEVFIGVSSHVYANAENPENLLGFFERGMYATSNGGESWSKIIGDKSFNDFEIDASGNLWAATTYSPGEGSDSRGGEIYRREKGETTVFERIAQVPQVTRTEIEASATNDQKFYILAEGAQSQEAEMWITRDAFTTLSRLNEPNDADEDIPASDFARNQAFYNLMIESDPTNDEIVYAGGIDLFRSDDSGATWEQISRWRDDIPHLDDLDVSVVHADHHVLQFRPDNPNQAVFGHDGGVSFARDLAAAPTSDVFITPERNYITTQFYSIAVAPNAFASGDYFLGGTQDNGTQLIQNGDPESIGVLGGDGAHSFYDQVNTDYLIANLVYNDLIVAYDYSAGDWRVIADNEDQDGFFINPQALDSNLDILFSNGPEGVLYRYDEVDELQEGDIGDGVIANRTSLTHQLLDASISALSVSPYTTSSSTVLLGLVNGKLLRVTQADGNLSQTNWRDISGPEFIGSISDVEYGASESELYVTFYNYGVKSVWYTENALDPTPQWHNKEGNLPDLPVLSILPNPLNENEVIIGTELGVWASKDFQNDPPQWEHSFNGMSDVKVTDLDLKRGTSEVYAASYGRGMFSGNFREAEPGEQPGGKTSPFLVSVYPSVSDGQYQITSQENTSVQIAVFDLKGQLVQMHSSDLLANLPTPLNLFSEASGIYFVQITYGNQKRVQRIIKK